jgi:hypothetical protein
MRLLKATLFLSCGLVLAAPAPSGAGELTYSDVNPFDIQMLTMMGRAEEAVEKAEEAIEGLRPTDNPVVLRMIGELLAYRCEAHRELGQYEQALAACQEAVATLESVSAVNSMAETVIYVRALPQLALTYEQAGYYEAALEVRQRLLMRLEGGRADDPEKVRLLTQIGDLYTGMGQFRDAETSYLAAISDSDKVYHSDRTFQPHPRLNLSTLYRLEERFAEAESILKDGLAELETTLSKLADIPSARASVRAAEISVPTLSLSLAWTYFEQQRFDDARYVAMGVLEDFEQKSLADSALATYARVLLGRIEDAQAPGSPDAENYLVTAVAAPLEEDFALSYFFHAIAQSELARHHLLNHRALEAAVLAREAVDTLSWSVGEDNHHTARAMVVLARVLQQQEKVDEALTHAQAAYATQWAYLPPYHSEIGETLALLAELYEAVADTGNLNATRAYLDDFELARAKFEAEK